ncbi:MULTISPECIES: 5-oxoprolinase subunit C family protein [Paenibacillus]|uniref:5-oxoprolinase subunit C family protein n=1 Tax=Paenibacillus TaxID=44249 RepID=UPI0011A7DF54|nr:biotin-dependent carboxyltransferase family protein [Paenibacillus sp. IHBB 10380]
MRLTVLKPGLLVTVQDLGRFGYGKYGVITSGAMDKESHRVANWLVGNPDEAAALEITWSGFSLRMEEDGWIAVTGGDLSPRIEDTPVPMWRPVYVRRDSVLTFQQVRFGCRAYLAVSGGLNVPKVMDSRSTYLRAGIGGWEGRPLHAGDRLSTYPSRLSNRSVDRSTITGAFYAPRWFALPGKIPATGQEVTVRAMPGRQYEDFDEVSQHGFFHQPFRIRPESDRMGYRLTGPDLRLTKAKEYVSEAVALGTIQVPADGQPIILMADRQTLGGYPKIAQIASVDIPLVAQLQPGGTLRFMEITLREAERLRDERERELAIVREMIKRKIEGVVP